ncbi:MAG: HAD hydrolase-like protein, partial [candidate division Zixibacteria bacterium]|nr:HAD hydrolase-like protein [candidate division Zixibacteria bacterium]
GYIMGKPSTHFYYNIIHRLKTKPQNCLFISDDPLSDLVGAKNLKTKTAFVLSGKYDRSILNSLGKKDRPDFIYKSIAEIKI